MVSKRSARSKRPKRQKGKPSSFFKTIIKIIIGFFIFLFFIVILLFAIYILAKPDISYKNIVFIPDRKSGGKSQILLAEFYQNTNSIKVIKFDNEIKSDLIGGYGQYRLGAVKGILDIDKRDDSFIKAAFGHFLGRGVDQIASYHLSKTPSSKIDLMKLFMSNKETFFDSLVVKGIDDSNVEFVEINSLEEWRTYLSKQLSWRIDDDCTVAIVNSTEVDGLATEFSNILENSGVEVVRSTTNIWGEQKTAFYSDDLENCPMVKQRLKSLSPVDLVEVKDTNKTSQYRASMVLFIGKELSEVLQENN